MLEVVLDQRLKDLLLVHRIVDASIALRRNRQLEVAGRSTRYLVGAVKDQLPILVGAGHVTFRNRETPSRIPCKKK